MSPDRDAKLDRPDQPVTLFLCGDVMTGRGIDQILPHPGKPELREAHVKDARAYVMLAETANGAVPAPVAPSYIWGDALAELERRAPAARIINLETAVTRSDAFWPGKEIHYRMHPLNVGCLTAARIDLCALANNHLLDFDHPGLGETLDVLRAVGIRTAGAGATLAEARRPAAVPLPGGRAVLVWALGSPSSGVPPGWAATNDRPGVDYLGDLSDASAAALATRIQQAKRANDLGIASIHWGSNWGYQVPTDQVRFARRLIEAGVDLVHGHSSHHPRPLEVHRGKLILYGCGDLISDYEGITGYERFKSHLVLMYFAKLDPVSGQLLALVMVPMQIRRMRLERASAADTRWLAARLTRACADFGSSVTPAADGALLLRWRH